MSDLPRITIVMPSFNQSRFIEEAIQSVLDQNYPNLEFMIFDGGSTDGSQEIIKLHSDHLTYWQSQSDAGQSDAIIQGFSRATGELMGWLNSDDILLPGALYHITEAQNFHPNAGLFGGNILWIDEYGNILRCRRPPSQAAFFARYGDFAIAQPGSFFRRKDYEAVGGLHSELKFTMDVDLYLRMLANQTQYVKVNDWVSGFRLQPFSKTSMERIKMDMEYEFVMQKYLPWVKSRRVGRIFYLGLQVINGNYIRLFLDNFFARGKHWREWCGRNHIVQSGDWRSAEG
jgi:glycosyltransferase involved in cell wall biosynthesis